MEFDLDTLGTPVPRVENKEPLRWFDVRGADGARPEWSGAFNRWVYYRPSGAIVNITNIEPYASIHPLHRPELPPEGLLPDGTVEAWQANQDAQAAMLEGTADNTPLWNPVMDNRVRDEHSRLWLPGDDRPRPTGEIMSALLLGYPAVSSTSSHRRDLPSPMSVYASRGEQRGKSVIATAAENYGAALVTPPKDD